MPHAASATRVRQRVVHQWHRHPLLYCALIPSSWFLATAGCWWRKKSGGEEKNDWGFQEERPFPVLIGRDPRGVVRSKSMARNGRARLGPGGWPVSRPWPRLRPGCGRELRETLRVRPQTKSNGPRPEHVRVRPTAERAQKWSWAAAQMGHWPPPLFFSSRSKWRKESVFINFSEAILMNVAMLISTQIWTNVIICLENRWVK
jgi:hypothetical protein